MKYIIKKILKEETESDEEKLILKGINLAVNSLKSDFPFIKGWEISEDMNEYGSTIYLNMFVDPKQVKEFYNLEKRELYDLYFDRYLVYPMGAFEYGDLDPYEETSKINEMLNDNYEFIPDEWKMNNRALPNEKKRLHFDHYKYV
jgi:hypothetical protein